MEEQGGGGRKWRGLTVRWVPRISDTLCSRHLLANRRRRKTCSGAADVEMIRAMTEHGRRGSRRGRGAGQWRATAVHFLGRARDGTPVPRIIREKHSQT